MSKSIKQTKLCLVVFPNLNIQCSVSETSGEPGYLSQHSDKLGTKQSSLDPHHWQDIFPLLQNTHTGYEAHPTSYSLACQGSFLKHKAARVCKWPTHHTVLPLRMSGAIPILPLHAFMAHVRNLMYKHYKGVLLVDLTYVSGGMHNSTSWIIFTSRMLCVAHSRALRTRTPLPHYSTQQS